MKRYVTQHQLAWPALLAGRDAAGVRLCTRNGNDFTKRFPLVVASIARCRRAPA
jgi:hypothetical protein